MRPNSTDQPLTSEALRSAFYQSHLDRVSRSFAFCIARLPEPQRARVALSYLLCRLLDTVEDAEWSSWAAQEAAFESFDGFLKQPPSASEFMRWSRSFPDSLPVGEIELLKDAGTLIADFHAWPLRLRKKLGELILSMSRGMRFYMKRKSVTGELRLAHVIDVNRYCFFVAGVVGEMLTEILREGGGASSRAQLRNAYRFGLFLQKVNLLKDQLGDEPQGRWLVPDRAAVLASLLGDARAAFDYLLSIPRTEFGYRLFCAWSLFLGLASLPYLQHSYSARETIKISRDETAILLGAVETILERDSELSELFGELERAGQDELAKIGGPRPRGKESSLPNSADLTELYTGDLTASEIAQLFECVT